MSFRKATDLLRLAEMASARHAGVSLADIEAEFEVDRRTAQRMTRALEDSFPGCETATDPERRKFWKLAPEAARMVFARGLGDAELAALEMAIRRAGRDGAANETRALAGLRDRLLQAMPRALARRAEADAEALLEATGFASRPGPRVRGDARRMGLIAQALKGPYLLTVTYAGARDPAPTERVIEPHGLLLGTRGYLVARPHAPGAADAAASAMRHYRLDRITQARLHMEVFSRVPEFDLAAHAARAFGSYHDADEYGEVVWRFAPRAAEVARGFLFHPDQRMEDLPDGSLEVRFHASGHLEMAWHLYRWGDAVEVLAPPALRALVQDRRRADFSALP